MDKRAAAKLLASFGASKGGRARAASLTPERRKEIAQQAARSRWDLPGGQKAAKRRAKAQKQNSGRKKDHPTTCQCIACRSGR